MAFIQLALPGGEEPEEPDALEELGKPEEPGEPEQLQQSSMFNVQDGRV